MTTPFELWLESGAAQDAADRWPIPDDIRLDAFLADAASDTAFDEWCRDQLTQENQ